MAINRTPFNALVDDDGSGLTGSVWNKAAIQSVILDPADAAYANKYDTAIASTATGTQSAWAPGLSGHTVVIWTGGAQLQIEGIAGGVVGQRFTILNQGSAPVLLVHQASSAAADNKLALMVTSGPTPIAPFGTATLEYINAFGGNWFLVAHEQGAYIDRAYSASTYSGYASMLWTVDAGDVIFDRWLVRGKELSVQTALVGSSIGGTPSNLLQFLLPNGYQLRANGGQGHAGLVRAQDNGPNATCTVNLGQVDYTHASIAKMDNTNWTASTNNTHVWIRFVCEII